MSTAAHPVTAEQLAAISRAGGISDGSRRELVEGELRMMSPAGSEHGRIAMRLGSLLEQHVRANQLGTVYAAETGFLISQNPDTVLAPDVAFVRSEVLEHFKDFQGFLPLAPDLVAEVVSPSDSFTRVEEKTLRWLRAGTQAVLIIDPGTRAIQVFRKENEAIVLTQEDSCDLGNIVTGWAFRMTDLFE